MLPTPSTSHISFNNIYEPAEDSYLLLDTLSSPTEAAWLKQRFPTTSPSPLILEVGVGSGVVLAFVAANASHILGRSDVALLGTDLNLHAVRAGSETVLRALEDSARDRVHRAISLGCIVGDLASAARAGEVDVLIFNPPYVPSESLPAALPESGSGPLSSHEIFERDSKLLELSYAGGQDGMETTNRLLSQLPDVLSKRGVAYILLCAQNEPSAVRARILAWPGGWSAEVVGSSGNKAGWEKLCILRIWRQNSSEP